MRGRRLRRWRRRLRGAIRWTEGQWQKPRTGKRVRIRHRHRNQSQQHMPHAHNRQHSRSFSVGAEFFGRICIGAACGLSAAVADAAVTAANTSSSSTAEAVRETARFMLFGGRVAGSGVCLLVVCV